jgi:hypothetical protein
MLLMTRPTPAEFRHPARCVRPRGRTHHLPGERHRVAFNLISEVIEHAVVRQRDEFFADALLHLLPFQPLPGIRPRSRGKRRGCQREEKREGNECAFNRFHGSFYSP